MASPTAYEVEDPGFKPRLATLSFATVNAQRDRREAWRLKIGYSFLSVFLVLLNEIIHSNSKRKEERRHSFDFTKDTSTTKFS